MLEGSPAPGQGKTYVQLWWPTLPTWDEALERLDTDPEARPAHALVGVAGVKRAPQYRSTVVVTERQ
jgi:hypothetical protein